MAITKSDIPALLLPGLRTEFELAYRSELENNPIAKLATVINTSRPSQTYAWLGATPAMREFVDERKPGSMTQNSVTIEDKVFESSIAVDRKAIEDDQFDLIRMRVQDLARRVIDHKHQLVVEALLGGFIQTGYDGVNFFSLSHPVGSGTFSNTISSELDEDGLIAATSGMALIPDDQGIPLGIVPDTLLVGPNQMWRAQSLVESPVTVYLGNVDHTAPSTPYANPFAGKLKVVVSPFIRGSFADYWFLLDTKRPMRSVILQQRSDVPVEFSAMEAPNSESAWMRDRYLYGVRGRYNVGYGLWQTAYGVSG
jgi:phage major head subunit gpT-like protein